ncbi:phosphatidylinositol-3-phosphatase myotubularin-1 [Canna indica]|uniref:Phosphatidylinositol-3-phosphatase myotubularin-1 n=1 Tax=Canna indica TaxID=4628 RepID=A0AAQ3KMU1_9LILI|nr:phosphatidylinositol-3-phosphatase myotubularin-1 [Canna indica]
MGSQEIASPECMPAAVGAGAGVEEVERRQNLQFYFAQSDERQFRGIGGEYVAGGTTPVNIWGKPIKNLSKTGGWIAAFFIFGNEMAERMAYFGLSVNMVIFMFYVMHRPFTSSANAVNTFLGISQISSVLGGFLADAYLGRYWTIAIFTTIYLLGLIGITLCATISIFVPNQDQCDKLSILLGACEPAKSWQMLYLYVVLYITGFGAAGIRPCVSSFGADQFDERSKDYKAHLDRFFNFFYLSVTIGAIMAFTMVVYIQMNHGWGSAFGSLAVAMGFSNVVFFVGTPLYRHKLPGGSPLTRVAQVLFAAFRKRNVPFSASDLIELYEVPGRNSAIKGSGKIEHTDDFRWLDKAALQVKEDGANPSPWRLCTVTQVEEVKILLKLLPIPMCTIMLSVVLTEYLTLSVQQAYTLNTHFGNLKLPVTCMPVFPGLSIFLVLALYYYTFAPLSRRITGHPHGASQLQRVGLGLAISILSVAWAGAFERYRRMYAIKHGYKSLFLTAMPNLSAYWLLIQYCLIGIAEVFCIVGLLEFLYQEAPDAMRSIGSAYAAIAGGIGCFVATIINNIRKKMENSGSWESLVVEWTTEELSRSGSHAHGMAEFLLDAEEVMVQGHGVVLVNTDEAGTLAVTNFRILFVSEISQHIIELGTIPLATIEKFNKHVVKLPSAPRQSSKAQPRRLLQVVGKDMRTVVFGFRRKSKQRRAVFDALCRFTKPEKLLDLYVFTCGPSTFKNDDPKLRLLKEYYRLLGKGSFHVTSTTIEDGSLSVSNDRWRITSINYNYTLCPTYPFALIVPKNISDEELLQVSNFRGRCRFPAISWCNPGTGAVLARSSQPLVGLMSQRNVADEKLVAALCTNINKGTRRKLYIADARPRKNALANGAMGGGSESSSNYFQSEVVFFGIENIHTMRDSLARLRDYLDTHGTTSSDGMSSFLRNGGWTWGGGNLSSMSASVSTLGDSGWLSHVQSLLAGSAWIAARVALESASVLVHCSDGWDRTTQLVSLASVLLDPYYRTFEGFQALVEKDWLAFGHPFSDRMGFPTLSGNNSIPELSRQSSVGSLSSSPLRIPSGSSGNSTHGQTSNNCSPIFLQWIDCVSQLLRMYPCAFEFSSAFLVDFLDCVLSYRFGNFLFNSEKERQQNAVVETSGCIWVYLTHLRAPEDDSHIHYNPFYDPAKYSGPLLPPAAALAPTLWPQFHLRWACPSEAGAGEIQSQWRTMTKKFTETAMAKESAEMKVNELQLRLDLLEEELQNEKQLRTSALAMASKASRESLAIKRAVQSLGCKVHFLGGGNDDVVNPGSSWLEREGSTLYARSDSSDGRGHPDEKADLSVSISATEENVHPNYHGSVCENICPFRTREGCKWPDVACSRFGSQLVGLKANFDAFDRLSIYDSYFGAD